MRQLSSQLSNPTDCHPHSTFRSLSLLTQQQHRRRRLVLEHTTDILLLPPPPTSSANSFMRLFGRLDRWWVVVCLLFFIFMASWLVWLGHSFVSVAYLASGQVTVMADGQVEWGQQDRNPREAQQQLTDDGHPVGDLTIAGRRHSNRTVNHAHLLRFVFFNRIPLLYIYTLHTHTQLIL